MSETIIIFLLLGVAHWCAMLLNSPYRTYTFLNSMAHFFLDAVVAVFGWPFHTIEYVHELYFRPKTVHTHGQFIAKLQGGIDVLGTIDLTQIKDETDEAFRIRVANEIANTILVAVENKRTAPNGKAT